jgi:hypothetical protein
MQFIYGLIIIFVLTGMYQSIYVLNKHVSSKNKEQKNKIIERDIQEFGSCCGHTESCTLDAKISKMRRDVEMALPESISETSAGGNVEKAPGDR